MDFQSGDRVVVEAKSTTRGSRAGVIQSVLREQPAPRYSIRWDDGHESILSPAAGSLRADSKQKRPRAKAAAPKPRAKKGDAARVEAG